MLRHVAIYPREPREPAIFSSVVGWRAVTPVPKSGISAADPRGMSLRSSGFRNWAAARRARRSVFRNAPELFGALPLRCLVRERIQDTRAIGIRLQPSQAPEPRVRQYSKPVAVPKSGTPAADPRGAGGRDARAARAGGTRATGHPIARAHSTSIRVIGEERWPAPNGSTAPPCSSDPNGSRFPDRSRRRGGQRPDSEQRPGHRRWQRARPTRRLRFAGEP